MLQKAGLRFTEIITASVCKDDCDKAIVMGYRSNEDIIWVRKRLPDWKQFLYNVDQTNTSTGLTVPKNKGHEAMVYLTYIIDNYNDLPSVVLFLHAHENGYRKAWHVDAPLHDQAYSVQAVQLDYVRRQGYVNLRCILEPGCTGSSGGAKDDLSLDHWNQIFHNTSTPPGWMAMQAQNSIPLAKNGSIMDPLSSQFLARRLPIIKVACCAQFAVTKKSIQLRPRSDYMAFREWLLNTSLPDHDSGRVFEYLWHIIFSESAKLCPDSEFCHCALYGRC